ncbi:hypothetical protein KAR91_27505 [Candidatus Pacearchaeota archaeon]|nr:hypothetical protein [Candidatus Pacearchaeota archaeon]
MREYITTFTNKRGAEEEVSEIIVRLKFVSHFTHETGELGFVGGYVEGIHPDWRDSFRSAYLEYLSNSDE